MRRLITFHSTKLPSVGEFLELSKESGHHLVKVLRAESGAKVKVFNEFQESGWGILEIQGNIIGLRMTEKASIPRLPVEKILIQALPKGQGFETILREATAIGVTKIVPIITTRTEVAIDPERSVKKMERWRSIVIEACKQSGNVHIPMIESVMPFKALEKYFKEQKVSNDLRLVASLEEDTQLLNHYLTSNVSQIYWAVGPEGDFTPEEYNYLREWEFKPVRLTQTILRVETAALYALSILDYELQNRIKA